MLAGAGVETSLDAARKECVRHKTNFHRGSEELDGAAGQLSR
ncbi:MAG: hypothetical protein ABSF12_12505 [Bryobacteraceae bacterium]|jgi:hypothetical protein